MYICNLKVVQITPYWFSLCLSFSCSLFLLSPSLYFSLRASVYILVYFSFIYLNLFEFNAGSCSIYFLLFIFFLFRLAAKIRGQREFKQYVTLSISFYPFKRINLLSKMQLISHNQIATLPHHHILFVAFFFFLLPTFRFPEGHYYHTTTTIYISFLLFVLFSSFFFLIFFSFSFSPSFVIIRSPPFLTPLYTPY